MKKVLQHIFAASLVFASVTAFSQTYTLTYTGAVQKIAVPGCTDSILVDIAGAQGGGGNDGSNIGNNGGYGGRVQAKIPVNGFDSLFIYVGGHGDSAVLPSMGGAGGWNGGDSGATIWSNYAGGGGGGGTDIRLNGYALTDRIVVAGGGGGGAYDCSFTAEQGGSGGGLVGDSGSHCDPEYAYGGTQTAGGAGAVYSGYGTGTDGSLGQGGVGGNPSAGGGGGGGYYGGGGGSWGGGGGGSGYIVPTGTNVTQTNGYQAGDGYVTITMIGNLTVTTTQTNNACNGGNSGTASITATSGTGPYTYTWAPGGQTSSAVAGLTAGTYTATVTDANTVCGGAKIVITQPTMLTVMTDSMTGVTCNGGTNGTIGGYATGGTSPYNYGWSNSETSLDITGLSAGTYTLTVTDNNGCVATASGTVTQPAPITVKIDSAIHPPCGDSLWAIVSGGTSPYNYMWSNSATKDSIGSLCSGKYTVVVTDNNGCKDSATINIVVAGIDEISANTGIKVYPVPTSGTLNLDILDKSYGLSAIAVYDVTGRSVMQEKTDINASHITMDVSKLDAGFYILRVTGASGQKDVRFEITK